MTQGAELVKIEDLNLYYLLGLFVKKVWHDKVGVWQRGWFFKRDTVTMASSTLFCFRQLRVTVGKPFLPFRYTFFCVFDPPSDFMKRLPDPIFFMSLIYCFFKYHCYVK